jgi:hypothetical protein
VIEPDSCRTPLWGSYMACRRAGFRLLPFIEIGLVLAHVKVILEVVLMGTTIL